MRQRTIAQAMIGAAVAALLTVTAGVGASTPRAEAADAGQFLAGNIISDALFFDGGSMTASQVQSFLNSKVPTCRAGYTCLKDYTMATASKAAVTGRCDAYTSTGVESAATIIAKVGTACGVSQRVLLVLLEKEQSLVTDDWPGAGQYRSATGYGCPDTAACDSLYYGFFNQVYNAALQFKRYAASPSSWNFIAGKTNQIQYSTNPACGSSAVFIYNQATAGLYNYTPYQPNAAALANLYGTGDGCSSYGNRNFWRLYTDWFGATTGGNLARTPDNNTVYVLSGAVKYPIASLDVLGALGPLGAIAYVSQSYLDTYTTGPLAGRITRSPDGTLYFIDSGIKLPFSSCGLVGDYGGSCASTGYMQLTADQLATFVSGPFMSSVLGTTTGSRYYITAGAKREILDDASQTAAGIPLGYNVLSDGAVSNLRTSTPIARDQAFAQQRGTSSYSFLSSGSRYGVTADGVTAAGLPAKAAGALNADSLAQIPASAGAFGGLVTATGSSVISILTGGSRYDWAGGGGAALQGAVPVTPAFLATYPSAGTINTGSFIKSPNSGTVFIVGPSDIKPVSSWGALLALIPKGAAPVIVTLPAPAFAGLPVGKTALTSGTLVRSPADATIYLVNGLTNKIPFSTFDYPSSIGIGGFSMVDSGVLAGYPAATVPMGYGITCGGTDYVAASGVLRALTATTKPLYPLVFTPLDSYTCAVLTVGAPATNFIRTPDGSIYLLDSGKRRPVSSMARFGQLGGSVGWVDVSAGLAATIPVGPLA